MKVAVTEKRAQPAPVPKASKPKPAPAHHESVQMVYSGLFTLADVMRGAPEQAFGDGSIQRQTATMGRSFSNLGVIQRDVVNAEIHQNEHKQVITNFARALNTAVQKAWALILKTPMLGPFRGIDGYTARWAELIHVFGQSKKAPSGLHTAFGYAVETLCTGPLAPDVPSGYTMILQGVRGGTRPDVILQFGGHDVAWLDITASASAGHIFDKAGGWEQAPSFAEITYPSVGPSDLTEMAQRADPDQEPDTDVNPEEYLENARRAAAELEEKREQWKAHFTTMLRSVKSISASLPDAEPQRRQATMKILAENGITLEERMVPHLLAAAGLNPTTYGFATGFSSSVATGVTILLDADPV